MPFAANLTRVKELLGISGTAFDTELTNTQNEGYREMLNLLREFGVSDPTNLQPDLVTELTDAENELTALRWRKLKAPAPEQGNLEAWISHIRERIQQFLRARFAGGVTFLRSDEL